MTVPVDDTFVAEVCKLRAGESNEKRAAGLIAAGEAVPGGDQLRRSLDRA
jgi:hypothetical protein